MFSEWWSSLSSLHQILYVIAIPSTIILVLQTILLLFGLGGNNDGDISHDMDFDGGIDLDGDGIPDVVHDGFIAHDHVYDQGASHDIGVRLFTVKGIVAFLVIGSWTAIAALDLGAHIAFASILGFVFGTAAMLLIGFFFKASMRLQQSGNLDSNNAVGAIAEVYLTIPPLGKGKVTLIIQDRLVEMEAVSTDDVDIPLKNGEDVIVKSIQNNILYVSPLPKNKSKYE